MADDPAGRAADVLRGYLACGDAGTLDDLGTWLHDDVVVHPSGGGPPYSGVPEAALTWAEAHEGLGSLRHEVHDVVAQRLPDGDDRVVARVRVSGTHDGAFLGLDPTGRPLAVDQGLFARVSQGRITELWEITDTGQALQQLGVVGVDQPLTPGPRPAGQPEPSEPVESPAATPTEPPDL
ncbi:ester cyclase [Cellulomonas aerilata]|uniref:ester cyclase n=1 Tax=Cellulomonas aerilata TaxID=515326 RepID=UPI0011BFA56E|nr:ester cyclase [Cellulomonas aerilata]